MHRLILLLFTCLLMCGCLQTRQTKAEQIARERELRRRQVQQQQEEARRRVELQMDDADARLAELEQELRRISLSVEAQPDQQDLNALAERITGLERKLQQIEVQRQKDREELIRVLSKRMADLMAQQQAARPPSTGRVHVVARGETLSAIAEAWEVSSQAIIRMNNIQNPDALKIGQKLTIP